MPHAEGAKSGLPAARRRHLDDLEVEHRDERGTQIAVASNGADGATFTVRLPAP